MSTLIHTFWQGDKEAFGGTAACFQAHLQVQLCT